MSCREHKGDYVSITFDQKTYTFKLVHRTRPTPPICFRFWMEDTCAILYWGGRIDAASLPFLSREYAGPYVRDAGEMEERTYPLTTLPQEFPCERLTDFRVSAARVTAENGTSVPDFRYWSHAVLKGKSPVDGLSPPYAGKEKA